MLVWAEAQNTVSRWEGCGVGGVRGDNPGGEQRPESGGGVGGGRQCAVSALTGLRAGGLRSSALAARTTKSNAEPVDEGGDKLESYK